MSHVTVMSNRVKGRKAGDADQLSLNNKMVVAACRGNLGQVRKLLNQGADIDAQEGDADGRTMMTSIKPYARTALTIAAYRGYTALVDLLIKKAADVNKAYPQYEGSSRAPLHAAIDGRTPSAREAIVKALLDAHASVDMRDDAQVTPLILAANWGEAKLCRILLANGANVEARDLNQCTPLYLSCFEMSNLSTMAVLLAADADPNVFCGEIRHIDRGSHSSDSRAFIYAGLDSFSATPLYRAVQSGEQARVQALVQRGAYVNTSLGEHRGTVLCFACQNQHVGIVETLIKRLALA
jgi:ankyrin repeat protein